MGTKVLSFTIRLTSVKALRSPYLILSKTILAILATIADVGALSAPPDKGKKNPLAPDLLR